MRKHASLVGLATFLLLEGFAALAGPSRAATEQPRLAIKGYDPVAYFTMGRPVQGTPEHEYALGEVRYRFATAEHLDVFRADPDHYTPRFRGLCAMGLAAKGYKVEADPENWVIHEGRLYLTQRDFGPRAFRKDPTRWRALAQAHLEELKDLPVGSGLSWW